MMTYITQHRIYFVFKCARRQNYFVSFEMLLAAYAARDVLWKDINFPIEFP